MQAPLHIGQALRGQPVLGLDLRLANVQKFGYFSCGGSLVQDQGNLFEPESQFAQGNDLMQTLQLGGVVGAIAAIRVHMGGGEQAGGIPMPQHAVGDLADLGKHPDG
ncbi:hypothetical protein D3C74_429160 [compost metagenome]